MFFKKSPYFWLHWVFSAACRLSLALESGGSLQFWRVGALSSCEGKGSLWFWRAGAVSRFGGRGLSLSRFGGRGLSPAVVWGLLAAAAPFAVEHRLQAHRLQ